MLFSTYHPQVLVQVRPWYLKTKANLLPVPLPKSQRLADASLVTGLNQSETVTEERLESSVAKAVGRVRYWERALFR